jgi:methylated-DNA-[protein]-cysteine S-methyltransferase
MASAAFNTPLGLARINGDVSGLTSVTVSDGYAKEGEPIPDVLKDAVAQLTAYFEGNRKQFNLLLNPAGTPFQKRVWQALLELPYGQTMSYRELSIRLGDVKAIRAVAAANGKNPLCILIPCHRVIGSDGSLTGYAGGLHRKRWLLDHESPARQHLLF